MMKYLFLSLLMSSSIISCHQSKALSSSNEMAVEETFLNLYDIWALVAIDGKEIDKEQFKQGVPTLEIYKDELRIIGFGGCNNYFGEIDKISNDTLIFKSIAATKKMCTDTDENTFFERLNNIESYQLGQMKLFLYADNNQSLSFKKID